VLSGFGQSRRPEGSSDVPLVPVVEEFVSLLGVPEEEVDPCPDKGDGAV
jgi:hypothetical protein